MITKGSIVDLDIDSDIPGWHEAVRDLGRPDFDRTLMRTLAARFGAVAMLGFLHLPGRMISLVSGGVGEREEIATVAAFRYGSRLWREDPGLVAGLARLPEARPRIVAIARGEIAVGPMGPRLFDFLGVGLQVSLFLRLGSGAYLLRLYFEDEVADRAGLAGEAELLLSLLIRHGELRKRSRVPVLASNARNAVAASLSDPEHGLTPREIEVLTGILLGRTAEAVSLDLGVRESSVRTYRKRAFRRLGISSQAQLFALCLNDATAR